MTDFFGGKVEIRIKDEKLYEVVERVKTSLYEQTVKGWFVSQNPHDIIAIQQQTLVVTC